MKILITGGSGMVGKNVLAILSNHDHELLSPNSTQLDLTNYKETIKYLKKNKPDFIIHSAGYVGGIQANISHPVDFLVNNLDIGRNIVFASYQVGIEKVLNLGSSCMYPRNAPNPLSEEMILNGKLEPTNEGYALAKIVTARLCEYIHRENSNFQYKTMIPCNIYGCHDNFDPDRSHLIPAIIRKLHQANMMEAKEVEIWGDGNARREFMYANDLANAILYSLNHFDEMPFILNIGIGKDYSIKEYYSIIADIIGFKGKFKHNLEKPVGMPQKLVSIEKQTIWGWKPTTKLRDGIQKTYDFYLHGEK